MNERQETLLLFSLGPVQKFIAAARKTEDLWSGSFLLSYLTGTAIRTVQTAAGDEGIIVSLVYPGSQSIDGASLSDIAILPNRFIIRIKQGESVAAGLAEIAVEAVRKEIMNLGEYAIHSVFSNITDKNEMTKIMEQQIGSLLETYWVLEPMKDESDYHRARSQAEKRMAAIKNCRPYNPYRQNGLVCTLCGEQTALTEHSISASDNYGQMKTNLINTWSKRRTEFKGLVDSLKEDELEGRIKDNEGLCSVCLTKRLARQYFREVDTAGSRDSFGPFPSIRDIADLSGYYAVIMMDGDDMGKWISGVKAGLTEIDIAYQQRLSNNLESFAHQLVPPEVKKSGGELIYAGGDDVLAFLPQREILTLVKSLRLGFGTYLTADMKVGDAEATASMGIVIAHEKAPLSMVLNYTREMEGKAKSYTHPLTGKEKDAIGLALITHSGEIREAVLPFSLTGKQYKGSPDECLISSLDSVLEMVENDLSIQFGGKFADAFLPLMGSDYKKLNKIEVLQDESLNRHLIKTELKRVMRRSIKEGRKIDDLERKTEKLMQLYDVSESLLQFVHLLEICRFLRSKKRIVDEGGKAI